MTPSLALLATAAAAVIAFGVSAVTFAVSRFSSRALDALAPAAQVRLFVVQAWLPGFAIVGLMTAAMAPWFGWIADHCLTQGDSHHSHPHLCADHHVMGIPGLPVIGLALVFLFRLVFVAGSMLRRILLAHSASRALGRASDPGPDDDLRVLPVSEPQAFVVGIVRPIIYLTRGLLAEEHARHLPTVLAHERAHVSRSDLLRRVLCQMAMAFHLPGVSCWFERRLARAQEMAADAVAADRVGSKERVAAALVHVARSRMRVPKLALPFGIEDLESRVHRLLFSRKELDFPGPKFVLAVGLLLGGLIAACAGSVHHAVEMALGLVEGG